MPSKYGDDIPFVKISDPDEAAEYGLEQETDLPKIVLFDNGIPEIYDDGKFISIASVYTFITKKILI